MPKFLIFWYQSQKGMQASKSLTINAAYNVIIQNDYTIGKYCMFKSYTLKCLEELDTRALGTMKGQVLFVRKSFCNIGARQNTSIRHHATSFVIRSSSFLISFCTLSTFIANTSWTPCSNCLLFWTPLDIVLCSVSSSVSDLPKLLAVKENKYLMVSILLDLN